MAEIVQGIKPYKLELDASETLRDEFNAQFIGNIRYTLNTNAQSGEAGNPSNQGGNIGIGTPIQTLDPLCEITLPDGDNICTGAYQSVKTQEIYYEVWNSESEHSIWVYGTEAGVCRKVYQGVCLNFQFPSQYHIPEHRAALFVVYDSDENGNQVIRSKFYRFTDGFNPQRFIDVETSILTDSFNAALYPYWTTFYPFCDPCEFIENGVRPPINCPVVLPFDSDIVLQEYEPEPLTNQLVDDVWYFRYRYVLTDGRRSVWSSISTMAYINQGNCPANNSVSPKCFLLQLNAGSALVERIEVAFSNDGITWFLYDTIEKWDDCESPAIEHFWERELALKNYFSPVDNPSTDCDSEGAFITATYTWDFDFSPTFDLDSVLVTIVINGQTYQYTTSSSGSLSELSEVFTQLGFDPFTVMGDSISATSTENVYGTITIEGSPLPDVEITPTIDDNITETGDANTFIYQFCGNKQCIPIDIAETDILEDALPIRSVGQAIIDDRLADANNLRGYNNFDCNLENIVITAVADEESCETEMVDIEIGAVIHNFYANKNQTVWKQSATTTVFGGLGDLSVGGIQYESEVGGNYQQTINNQYENFIGRLRGTPFRSVAQLYKIGTTDPIDLPEPLNSDNSRRNMMVGAYGGAYYYLKFKFRVPKGNYIFQIDSHLSDGVANSEFTSTYFYGVLPITGYNPDGVLSGLDNTVREVRFEACEDFTYDHYVVIADLTKPTASVGFNGDAKAFAGYLREEDTNSAIELAHVEPTECNTTPKTITLCTPQTDHNGFFFGTDGGADYCVNITVLGTDCSLSGGLNQVNVNTKTLIAQNVIEDTPSSDFNVCGHQLVSGIITDCDGNPIAGVSVVLSQTGRYGVTDKDGRYTILAHDNAFTFATQGLNRREKDEDNLFISPTGACLLNVCDDCNACIDVEHVTWEGADCFTCPVETVEINFQFDHLAAQSQTLHRGGRYPVGIVGFDEIKRSNFVKLLGYYDVPTVQETGTFASYHFDFSITGDLELDSWVKQIAFVVGDNANYTFVLTWIVSKVEFVDVQGNVTTSPSAASKIKIYIEGLNEYNLQNNLTTNTNYQFVKGDIVEFVTNGNGVIFSTATNGGLITAEVNADVTTGTTSAGSFLIDYDVRLKDLTSGAMIKLYRIPQCTTKPVYWEQCQPIVVTETPSSEGGEPVTLSGTIPFFDAYFLYRAIPQTNQDGLPEIFVSAQPFEHHSPSDFFGDHKYAVGRPFTENTSARQTWKPDEIAWSNSLLEDGNINGLGTWLVANVKDYGIQNFGGIVAIHAERRFLFAICENDWFIVSIDDNLLRATQAGEIYVNTSGFLSESQQKIGNIYGCDMRDTSTILFKNEWISWVDVRKTSVCLSDYQRVWDITIKSDASEGGVKSYFVPKLRYVASRRDENNFGEMFMYIVSGYDPKRGEIIYTFFARTNAADVESEGLSPMFGTALTYLPSLDYYQNSVWNEFIDDIGFQQGAFTVGSEDHWIHFTSRTGGYNSIPSAIVIPRVGMGANLDEIFYYTNSTGGAYNLQSGFNDTGVDFFIASVAYAKAHSQTFIFTVNVSHGTVSEMAQFLDYLVTQGVSFKVRYGNEMSVGSTSSIPGVALTSGEYLALVLPFDDYVQSHYPTAKRVINAADHSNVKWNNSSVAAFAIAEGIEEFTQYGWLGDLAGSPNANTNIASYFNEAINVLRDSVAVGNHSLYGEVLPRILGYATTFAGLKMHVGQYGVSLQRSGYAVNTMLHGILIWNELFEFLKFNQTHSNFINSAIFLVNESAVDKKTGADNLFTINPAWTVTDGATIFVKRIQGVAYEMLKDLAQYRGTPIYLTVDRTGFPARFDMIAYQLGGRVFVYAYNLSGSQQTLSTLPITEQSADGLLDRQSVYATQLYGSIGNSPAYTQFKNNGFNPGLAANNVLLLEETIDDTNIVFPINSITTLSFEVDATDDSTELSFANERRDYSNEDSETISFNYYGRYWSGTYGFTPEYYICFQSGRLGDQLLSFVNGKAWMHHNQEPSALTYNNFYGTNVPKVLQPVFNKGKDQKRWLAVRVECKEHLWFSDSIQTQTGQLSQIPLLAFEMIENYSEAEMLCDENTTDPSGISALIDGDSLFGNWIKMRFVGDEEFINDYCEIQMIIVSSTLSY